MSKVKIGKKIPSFSTILDDGSELNRKILMENILSYISIQKIAHPDAQKKVRTSEIFIKNSSKAMLRFTVYQGIRSLHIKNLRQNINSRLI